MGGRGGGAHRADKLGGPPLRARQACVRLREAGGSAAPRADKSGGQERAERSRRQREHALHATVPCPARGGGALPAGPLRQKGKASPKAPAGCVRARARCPSLAALFSFPGARVGGRAHGSVRSGESRSWPRGRRERVMVGAVSPEGTRSEAAGGRWPSAPPVAAGTPPPELPVARGERGDGRARGLAAQVGRVAHSPVLASCRDPAPAESAGKTKRAETPVNSSFNISTAAGRALRERGWGLASGGTRPVTPSSARSPPAGHPLPRLCARQHRRSPPPAEGHPSERLRGRET